jgi:hypothetical protein
MGSLLHRPALLIAWAGLAGLLTIFLPNDAHATETSCYRHFSSLLGPTDEELNLLISRRGDLFVLPTRPPEEARALNEAALRSLREAPMPGTAYSRRKAGLTPAEIQKLYDDSMLNPQVMKSLCGKYNGSPRYGLCWGRAMAVHLKALQSDINNKSVKKMWAIGSLKSGLTHWRYHVTTLVRAEDGSWHAIDPIFGRPMPAEEWYATMRSKYDPEGTMRIFASPAKRFGPGSWEQYNKKELSDAVYYNFFSDLMNGIYTENTGRVGPWRAVSDSKKLAVRAKKLKKLLVAVGVSGAAAAYGHQVYLASQALSRNRARRSPDPAPLPDIRDFEATPDQLPEEQQDDLAPWLPREPLFP